MNFFSRRSLASFSTEEVRGRRAGVAVVTAMVAAFTLATMSAPASAGDVDVASLWKKNCQSCHGPDGKGDTKAGKKAGVKDLTSAEVKADLTREKAVETIKNGVKKEDSEKMAMKAYGEKLSEAEISALADHALTLK